MPIIFIWSFILNISFEHSTTITILISLALGILVLFSITPLKYSRKTKSDNKLKKFNYANHH